MPIKINYIFLITYIGGARRDRTADPLLAKQVLSQLSYGPFKAVSALSYRLIC
ncbi:hypothetical protein NOC27_1665 [Nitrosococcus oceani AFC27]|nr:hypothetical protein NOC27_1665 [Nitrosococcus oceani AFC27]